MTQIDSFEYTVKCFALTLEELCKKFLERTCIAALERIVSLVKTI